MDIKNLNIAQDDGSEPYNLDERIAIQHKALDIFDILYEDGNIGFYHCRVMEVHRNLRYLYAKKGDDSAALKHLRLAAKHAITFDKESHDHTLEYTCLLFRGQNQYAGYSSNSPENNSSELLELIEKSPVYYDPIRQNPEFIAIEKELREHAGPRWRG